MFTTNETVRIGSHDVQAVVIRDGTGTGHVLSGRVLTLDRTGIAGLVQGNADGTNWITSIGDGWTEVDFASIHDAVDFVALTFQIRRENGEL